MDRKLLKATFYHVLKRYPIVLFIMTLLGIFLVKKMSDPLLALACVIAGAIIGPALAGIFHYRLLAKKQEPANRLIQASKLLKEGLISDEEYEQIRRSTIDSLSGREKGTEINHGSSEDETPLKDKSCELSMKIHPFLAVLVAMGWPLVGIFLSRTILNMMLGLELPKIIYSLINIPVGCFGAFYLFPKIYRAPFGNIPFREYLKRLGLYFPKNTLHHILLGIILACCTLSGMLAGSVLTGRYQVDWSTVNFSHTIFSLNPAIFEEIFYRGIMVMLLLIIVKSLKKALALQVIIFGLAHFRGAELTALIDMLSVMLIAIAFTYCAYKTGLLIAGIVFHFLHNAFLYLVQLPEGIYTGFYENAVFYACLWLMVFISCILIRISSEKLHVHGKRDLYSLQKNCGLKSSDLLEYREGQEA